MNSHPLALLGGAYCTNDKFQQDAYLQALAHKVAICQQQTRKTGQRAGSKIASYLQNRQTSCPEALIMQHMRILNMHVPAIHDTMLSILWTNPVILDYATTTQLYQAARLSTQNQQDSILAQVQQKCKKVWQVFVSPGTEQPSCRRKPHRPPRSQIITAANVLRGQLSLPCGRLHSQAQFMQPAASTMHSATSSVSMCMILENGPGWT